MPTTSKPLMTKREWLATQKGPDNKPLAIPGARGRFSHAAQAALAEAEKKGMKWAEPEVKVPAQREKTKTVKTETAKPLKPEGDYDPKEVRAWATQTGITLSERGRIPAEVLNSYFAANGKADLIKEKPKSTVTVLIDRPKVRKETVAWGYARRKPEDGPHISEPVTQFQKCGKCSMGIAYCNCQNGPFVPMWMTNGKLESGMLKKPLV